MNMKCEMYSGMRKLRRFVLTEIMCIGYTRNLIRFECGANFQAVQIRCQNYINTMQLRNVTKSSNFHTTLFSVVG